MEAPLTNSRTLGQQEENNEVDSTNVMNLQGRRFISWTSTASRLNQENGNHVQSNSLQRTVRRNDPASAIQVSEN